MSSAIARPALNPVDARNRCRGKCPQRNNIRERAQQHRIWPLKTSGNMTLKIETILQERRKMGRPTSAPDRYGGVWMRTGAEWKPCVRGTQYVGTCRCLQGVGPAVAGPGRAGVSRCRHRQPGGSVTGVHARAGRVASGGFAGPRSSVR